MDSSRFTMADELLLSPEITVHEEPGHITIDNQDVVSVEVDEDELPAQVRRQQRLLPFPNGDIPPEISITKVTGRGRSASAAGTGRTLGQPPVPRAMLKVRSDLGMVPVPPAGSPYYPPMRPEVGRPVMRPPPPPLTKAGSSLPPMPRLKFGGPRVQRPPVHMGGLMGTQQHLHHQQQQHHMMQQRGMRPIPPKHGLPPGMIPPPGFAHPMNMDSSNGGGSSYLNAPPDRYIGRASFGGGGLPKQHSRRPSSTGPTVINVNSPDYGSKMVATGVPPPLRSPGFPPPMIRPGSSKGAGMSTHSQVRTVFVPPPMKISHPKVSSSNNGFGSGYHRQLYPQRPQTNVRMVADEQDEGEIDDDEEEAVLDEEELDDVEPDVDPNTNEVDDVEPGEEQDDAMAALREQEALIRSIDKHQVTVSITPKSAMNKASVAKSPPVPDTVSVTATHVSSASTSALQGKVQYVRRPDGKGFMRKVIDRSAMNRIKAKKKKKKKAFRGINYRFDGSRIKKRVVRKPQQQQPQQQQQQPQQQQQQQQQQDGSAPQDSSFLEYLGIQRKDSTDSKLSLAESGDSLKSAGQKAKKSFKVVGSHQTQSRIPSTDDAASTDSGSAAQKRRLSLSEVLSNQKKMRPSQQTVRHSFGRIAATGRRTFAPAAAGAATAAAAVDMKGVPSTSGSAFTFSEDAKDAGEEEEPAEDSAHPLPRLRQRRKPPTPPSSSGRKRLETRPPSPLQPCVCACALPDEELDEASVGALHGVGDGEGPSTRCQAVESVGAKRVGCTNLVEGRKPRQRRVAAEKGGKTMLLCQDHAQRLRGHHVCPYCMEFCAHGIFFMCRPTKRSPPHLFHKHCYLRLDKRERKCPHCHSTEQPLIVQLKLHMAKVPLELLQVTSKMTFPQKSSQANKAKSKTDEILARENAVTYKLPDGKIISSEGMPQGISNEALKDVIEALQDKQTAKHTTRNMYIPVKSGDNVKILQMLSMGYSANQRLSECDGATPLHVAASEGHVLTMHMLVQAGAELDTMNDEQNTALMLSCIKGKPEAAKYLLQAGADVTQIGDDGMTCLHLATQNGFLECAHVILSQSHLPRNFLNKQDDGGWTPLVWACENKHELVIRYLLDRGADPLITDVEGNITLHWAALSGSKSTCELLLNAGCDVNATNTIGETPMHIALRQDHYDCGLLFLMRGARLDIRNKNRLTPAECMVKDSEDLDCRAIVRLSTTLQEMMRDVKTARSERIVCNDISRGKESAPIQVVNAVDDAGEPSGYVYISRNCVTNAIPLDANISKLQHCKCGDNCSSEDTCHCSDLSVKSWYDSQGQLKEDFDFKDPPMIFECNEMCSCHVSTCHNRVIQHGITARLQVYRTEGMGWGVRALADIPRGAFVCEYVGEIISDSEADTREDSYLFDLDNRDGETYCLDANKYGNIARFINHSCSPNLVPVKVFAHHQDLRFPHIALFASREIPKGQELGFDYGEKFWVIKHKYFTCCCSIEKCRYNKSSIQSFLREYYTRIGEPMPEDLASAGSSPSSSSKAGAVASKEPAANDAESSDGTKDRTDQAPPEALSSSSAASSAPSAPASVASAATTKKSDAPPPEPPTSDSRGGATKNVKREPSEKKVSTPAEAACGGEAAKKKAEPAPPVVVVKKEACDDTSSEDGHERRSGGRPRRAATKKAAGEEGSK